MEAAGELLADGAAMLETLGAPMIVLPANTMHIVAARSSQRSPCPFLNRRRDYRCGEAGRHAEGRVARPRYTMEPFLLPTTRLPAPPRRSVPGEDERQVVHDVIYGELVNRIVHDASRRRYLEIIDDGRGWGGA